MRLRPGTLVGAAALALAGLITVSCGGVTDPSSNATDTLTVTVTTRGGQSEIKTFQINNTGEYSVRATGSNPTFSSQFVLAVGIGDASSCGVIQAPAVTVNGISVGGAVQQKGTYCVFVQDAFNTFSQVPITFTIQANHP